MIDAFLFWSETTDLTRFLSAWVEYPEWARMPSSSRPRRRGGSSRALAARYPHSPVSVGPVDKPWCRPRPRASTLTDPSPASNHGKRLRGPVGCPVVPLSGFARPSSAVGAATLARICRTLGWATPLVLNARELTLLPP